MSSNHRIQSLLPTQPAKDEKFFLAESLLTLMKKAEVPGMSLAVVTAGKTANHFAIGTMDVASKNAVKPDSLFPAASLSKPVFAYLVFILLEKRILPENFLDKPLYEILPTHQSFFGGKTVDLANDKFGRMITPRMILSHCSGFPNWVNPEDKNPFKFLFTPGSQYNYSGEGYFYLQNVIKKITNKSLQELAKEHIFGPLKMNHSCFSAPPIGPTLAVGHDQGMKPQCDMGKPDENAGGSLHTTARDYALFLEALIKKKGISQTELFIPSIEMTSNKAAVEKGIQEDVLKSIFWGLGWGLQKTTEGMIAWQWGEKPNFRAFVAINLTNQNAVVYLTNSENGLKLAKGLVNPVVGNTGPLFNYLNNMQRKTTNPTITKKTEKTDSHSKKLTEAIEAEKPNKLKK